MFEAKTSKGIELGNAGWYSLQEMAVIFGITPQHFSKSVRPLLDAKDVRDAGKKGTLIHASAAISAVVKAKVRKAEAAASAKIDPLLAGPDDAGGGLARYRIARAEQEELRLAEMKREMVNLKQLTTWLGLYTSAFRATGDRLVREFGNRAADIFNDGIETALQHLEAMDSLDSSSEAADGRP